MDIIITHVNVDLDAALSLAAAREFIPGAKEAKVVFQPANWDGELDGEALILDMLAGGRGIKGERESDGLIHSCFKSIVETYASIEDQEVLRHLVQFVDLQDMHGSALDHLLPDIDYEVKNVFGVTGLNAVLRALQTYHGRDSDKVVCQRMEEIFIGRLRAGRARRKAEVEAVGIPILYDGKVAVVTDAKYTSTTGIMFSKHGVRIIIYKNGNDLGIIRGSSETLRLDHPDFQSVVEEAGESHEWFAHSAGFLYCRGSRKAPALTSSKVDPYRLAEVAARLLDEERQAAAQDLSL